MKNKLMLVSVGREKLHITVTTDLGTTNTINTHELHMTDAKNTTNLIYDMYFNEGINGLFIDRTGSGLVVIDSLVGKFERAGYKYDYEKGTVQPVGEEDSNDVDFMSSFFLLVMEKLDISFEEINKFELNTDKGKWNLNDGLTSEVSKIINNKWEEIQEKILELDRQEMERLSSPNNITINVTVANGKESDAERFTKQIMSTLKRTKGMRG